MVEVTEKEWEAKAKWVADMMLADGLRADQLTEDLVFAYMDAIDRKIMNMTSIYISNPEAKSAMSQFVRESL